ncbi:phage minor head protein [Salinisphaera orenii]|uniref:Phage head morphogenesis protein n=1 Tax=Salinisphaera orenii YIM 95161 TaxID=1051139 RepID=A0A423PRN7_9GAMM|nr:phage minor head protein [Salinisphaera halophila]ROO28238.1 phage head morphogenesis protein [Salinisphaera halophila YIM 95161]
MAETRNPGPVPQDALDYWRGKDVRPGFSHEDVWGDEHAHAFTVAKMTKLDLLEDTRASLEDALAEGKTFRQWSNEIRPRMQAKGWWGVKEQIDPATGLPERVQLGSPRRLKTIYRANMRSARAAGQWQRIQRTKESRPYLVYLLGPSEEHRAEHVDLQGLTLPVDDPTWGEIYPPNGYGCFSTDTLVRCNAQLGLKTWYAGEMVELHSARGNHFTATANHPVLTARGWVAAGDLREGDQLIDAGVGVDAGIVGVVDDEQTPARADDLFDALARERLRVVPMAAHDFYGDTVGRQPEIQVASADGDLMDRVDASADERIREVTFGRGLHRGVEAANIALGSSQATSVVGNTAQTQHAADARLGHAQTAGNLGLAGQAGAVEGDDTTFGRIVRGICRLPRRAQQLLGLAPRLDTDPTLRRCRASAAPLNAVPVEDATQRAPADAQLFGQLLQRNTGLVATDEVRLVRKFEWSGHVYDFATDTGLIVAGGIVVSNCKCYVNQIDQATRDRYVEDGVPDATAAQEIDPESGLPTGRRVTRQVPAKTERPELKRRRYKSKRTGREQYAPEGVHPAWANNSGQARVRTLREALAGKIETADQQLARESVKRVVDSPALTQFLDEADAHKAVLARTADDIDEAARRRIIDGIGDLPVAYADRELAEHVGSQTQLVRMSAETAGKQLVTHADLVSGDYRNLDALLATGEVLRESAREVVVFGEIEGELYRAVLKRAGTDNRELFLSTFHRAKAKQHGKAREAMKRLRASR